MLCSYPRSLSWYPMVWYIYLSRTVQYYIKGYQLKFQPIEVFHTREQNHVTAGGGSILGVTFCNSCSGSGRYDIETTCATLVKESRNVQTKYRSSGSNYPYAVLVILFYIINMHGLTRIGPTQSLLGYPDIVIDIVFN